MLKGDTRSMPQQPSPPQLVDIRSCDDQVTLHGRNKTPDALHWAQGYQDRYGQCTTDDTVITVKKTDLSSGGRGGVAVWR